MGGERVMGHEGGTEVTEAGWRGSVAAGDCEGSARAVAKEGGEGSGETQARGGQEEGFRHAADDLPGFCAGGVDPRAEGRVSGAGGSSGKAAARGGMAALGVDRCLESLCGA
ncbi:hypothetical protein B1218_37665, partial [Pseudomonas ogarae]